ncbi:hypothetical protein [Methylobacterium durans]|uniref:Porin n=1 Tax=Methylobacterium durans TaxID=2202825 RepID=A0A2U8WD18_9HYPH|nr:hypothetical protein [Methylobacterium durans]AWN44047.1 hypothetical protein DK389_30515 [Methylobacterium durans]
MNKIWIGCAGTAAVLAALLVAPGQAAPQAPVAAPIRAELARAVKPTQVAVQEVVQPATVQLPSRETSARPVRVVYPSPYATQR